MSLAIEKILAPATGQPSRPAAVEAEQKLNIAVVFTSVQATLVALKEAGSLANSLGARITLVVPQLVPYPLPLETSLAASPGPEFSSLPGSLFISH